MKVKCINENGFAYITAGEIYKVISVDFDDEKCYLITNNNGEEFYYNSSLFEIVKEEKVEFKIGDKVVLDIPKGKEFKEGGVGFNSGIVDKMVDIVNNTKIFTIEDMSSDFLYFYKCDYQWDKNWFKLYIEEENNMFDWNKFLRGEIVIQCDNKEEWDDFTRECDKRGVKFIFPSSCYLYKYAEYSYSLIYRTNYTDATIVHWNIEKSTTQTSLAQFDTIALKVESGGTYMSSGLGLALQDMIANDYYNGFNNIKVIQMGDGDNWSEDNEKLCNLVRNLLKNGVDYQYYEVNPPTYSCGLISEKLIDNIKGIEGRIHTIKTEKKIKTTIYKIEHKVNGKLYSFISDIKLDKGDIVQCLTKDKAITYGRIMSVITKKLTKDKISEYSKCRRVI